MRYRGWPYWFDLNAALIERWHACLLDVDLRASSKEALFALIDLTEGVRS